MKAFYNNLSLKYLPNKISNLTSKKVKNISLKSKLLLTSTLTISTYLYFNNNNSDNILKTISSLNPFSSFSQQPLQCYKTEDKEIRRVKDIISEKIKNLEFKYQGDLPRQNIDYGIKNGKYYIEFSIIKQGVNPDEIINALLKHSVDNNKTKNNNKNELSAMSKENFKVIDQIKFSEDDVVSFKIDFEVGSNTVAYAKNRGTIYLKGAYGKVYDNFKFTLEKNNDFCDSDINVIETVYEQAFKPNKNNNNNAIYKGKIGKRNNDVNPFSGIFNQDNNNKESEDPRAVLHKHGVMIFEPDNSEKSYDWGYLAGYETQKRMIEDSVLLGLTHGEIFDQITRETRVKFEPNRPRAILFEGPPGCGKTTSAKIIANQVKIPLIYMPLESIMSKFYGESENKFADIFEAAQALGNSIIFIDEIDALATSRDNGIHEATRRILSTLLRKIDGFESDGNVMFICATNRRKDLDPALLSRLDITVTFDLPDSRMRALIYQKYAKQLQPSELERLAQMSDKFSGRDIADVCKDTERKWASKFIRKETDTVIPKLDSYEESINQRAKYLINKNTNL